MRRTGLSFLVFLASTAVACSQSQGPGASPVSPAAVGLDAKPGGPPIISLRVTVSNMDAFGNPSGITNDGQGDYVDGVQNVQAQLDSAGTLAFNTFNANHGSASRWVNYDFTRPVDPLNTFNPPQDHTQNYHFSTGSSQFSPWVAVQYLGTPGYPATECGYMGNGFQSDNRTNYRVSFHKGNEDTQGSATSFAVFTRVSVSPAVWTVQPVGSCSPSSNVSALRSGDGTILYGYYTMPFSFTLTAK